MADTVRGASAPPPPVVTLFETYGSGASYIGPRVAQALGLPFHGQAFSTEDIEGAEARHDSEGPLSRVLGNLGGSYAGIEGPGVAMAQRDDYEAVLANTRAVHESAREGGVILGRNGALILANRPATLHVKLDAPVQQRVARAAKDSGIDVARAAKRQKREDQVRTDLSLTFYAFDPREDDSYDLVVNTGTLDLDACVDIIVAAARRKAQGVAAPPLAM